MMAFPNCTEDDMPPQTVAFERAKLLMLAFAEHIGRHDPRGHTSQSTQEQAIGDTLAQGQKKPDGHVTLTEVLGQK